jgi:hypothetical protein
VNLHQQQANMDQYYLRGTLRIVFFFSTTVSVCPSFPDSIYLRTLWLKYYEIFAWNKNTKVDPFSL